jgi:hypothetical protein
MFKDSILQDTENGEMPNFFIKLSLEPFLIKDICVYVSPNQNDETKNACMHSVVLSQPGVMLPLLSERKAWCYGDIHGSNPGSHRKRISLRYTSF